jgi:endonuclease/exonuclease/phosphatase family metal-dependent hydrolase
VILSLCLSFSGAFAADTLRVTTYNSLNFRGSADATRAAYFRTVIRALQPDIVAMQEIQSEAAIDYLLSNVFLNVNSDWQAADYMSGPDTQNAFFYRSSKVALVSQRTWATSLRNIGEYVIRPAVQDTSLRFKLFSGHLKAGSTTEDSTRRIGECQIMRDIANGLPAGSNFAFCGDFNLYTSGERCYQLLLEAGSNANGRFYDPLNMPGDWHDNNQFALIHTQSTRTASLGDGGATGGCDDRFDFMLVSGALMDTAGSKVIPGTYRSFGNDGQHLNQPINSGTNHVVPDSVANALMSASDHLPVCVDMVLRSATDAVVERPTPARDFKVLNCYPNPFNSKLTIELSSAAGQGKLSVYDILGRPVTEKDFRAGSTPRSIQVDFSGQGTGTYFVRWMDVRGAEIQKVSYIR